MSYAEQMTGGSYPNPELRRPLGDQESSPLPSAALSFASRPPTLVPRVARPQHRASRRTSTAGGGQGSLSEAVVCVCARITLRCASGSTNTPELVPAVCALQYLGTDPTVQNAPYDPTRPAASFLRPPTYPYILHA
eukprot:618772-Rhodomonas_salina.1